MKLTPLDRGDGGWGQKLCSYIENNFCRQPRGVVGSDLRLNDFWGRGMGDRNCFPQFPSPIPSSEASFLLISPVIILGGRDEGQKLCLYKGKHFCALSPAPKMIQLEIGIDDTQFLSAPVVWHRFHVRIDDSPLLNYRFKIIRLGNNRNHSDQGLRSKLITLSSDWI